MNKIFIILKTCIILNQFKAGQYLRLFEIDRLNTHSTVYGNTDVQFWWCVLKEFIPSGFKLVVKW